MDTAIEWLELQFEKYTRAGVQVPNEKLFKLTEKAKQKEKEQMINFCWECLQGDNIHTITNSSELIQYINDKFDKIHNQII